MAAYDQSFNAEGPTVVAFETVSLVPSEVPAFGVAVFAHQCGVNGIALSDIPSNAHRVAPDLVGVHGLGESEGVQGEGPIGIHGISRVPGSIGGQGVGVLGEGGQVGIRGKGNTGVLGEGTQAGVEGRGTIGVLGDGDIGIKGSGESAGVHGFSGHNRAGVFQTEQDELPPLDQFTSTPSAQVLLVPVKVVGPVEEHLPRAGLAGDLFAAIDVREARVATAELWFCVHDGSANPNEAGAVWSKVQFSTTITVA